MQYEQLELEAIIGALAVRYERLVSYADALTAAIQRQPAIRIDGLTFNRRTDIAVPAHLVSSGRHALIYELAGTSKQYRIIVEPVPETHR